MQQDWISPIKVHIPRSYYQMFKWQNIIFYWTVLIWLQTGTQTPYKNMNGIKMKLIRIYLNLITLSCRILFVHTGFYMCLTCAWWRVLIRIGDRLFGMWNLFIYIYMYFLTRNMMVFLLLPPIYHFFHSLFLISCCYFQINTGSLKRKSCCGSWSFAAWSELPDQQLQEPSFYLDV